MTHERARELVEFYLRAKGETPAFNNRVKFHKEFVEEHKLQKRFQGHSYDIVTENNIIEIDDLKRHSKKSQIINDQIAADYAVKYHPEYRFYRLLKEEIVDSKGYLQPTAAQYLKENLF